ncbi:MAG: tyrosine-type recombinase/integrase [Desulfuromonadaceae bacterium]
MAKIKLTQRFVERCDGAQGRKVYYDSVCPGLVLEVRSSSMAYHLRYRDAHGSTRQRKIVDARRVKLSDARELAQEYQALILRGEDPFLARDGRKQVPTFAEFVQEMYLPYVKSYKRSWKTDECLLRNHILPALGHKHLDQVKRMDLIGLFSAHRSTHKPGSTNRIIILCRYIFNCALKWDVPGITSNPSAGIDLYQENNKRERYLNQKEALRLFEALERSESKHLKYIITMLLLTGARKNEVLNAKWTDFDLEQRIWSIEFNKSGKTRHVPLSDSVMRLLETLPRTEDNPYLFPSPVTGEPYVQIFNSWDTARKRAGLADVRIHDLRHSFASFLINSGRSLYEVQNILGHTQVKTTQRYSHLSQESLISAANTAATLLPLGKVIPADVKNMPLLSVKTPADTDEGTAA